MKLVPMTQAEFDAWLEQDIRVYAGEKIRAGAWQAAEALDRSRQEHLRLLPDGPATKDHYLYTLVDESSGVSVGMLWVARVERGGKPIAFLNDIKIDEQFRGRGYGKQAMLALEDTARGLGLDTIGLHVFGHNTIARDLYLKVGYQITDYNMEKKLK